jgi:beta-aspartyl-peptidase (threonine type)
MNKPAVVYIFSIFLLALFAASPPATYGQGQSNGVVLVIHGGAGTILKENMTPEKESMYRNKLTEALKSGMAVLQRGGSSLDAVEAAIRVMEDSPLFNAGKGAVFTNQGHNEMDASIMDGNTLNAGAVASVINIKNPISAARKVMTESKHVMLVGEGAGQFAAENGLELADSAYFFTQERWDRLQKAKEREANQSGARSERRTGEKFGTVGAVALDRNGNLAAGTSTGGLTNKRFGRVGDSPIIGAGTYANNKTCGVSGTGVGEYFMRGLVAYDVSAHMEYVGFDLAAASDKVIKKLTSMGGTGGFIALDKDGNVAMPFNTPGMYRGYIRGDGTAHVFFYGQESGTDAQ